MVIEVDPQSISKLTQQVEQVTCIECCKYYIAPETAACGHSLCHACWKGRRVCHTCAAPIDRKVLKLNLPLQAHTEHVHALADAFEKLFNVKLEEFTLDILDDLQSEDPTKHVKEWLANSENHFSAPVASSQMSEPELSKPMELSKTKIQIHTVNNKTKSPEKVVKPPQTQRDWDKIEVLPDTEEIYEKNKEHVVGPMDIEPFVFDEIEYAKDKPRRSLRKRELKPEVNLPTCDMSIDKNSAKNSSTETKSLKNKQTWNSVKKMRKEFSKLNKKNKSRLNVSIEMCKKAQNANKQKQAQVLCQPIDSEHNNLIIEDNTPQTSNCNKNNSNNKGDIVIDRNEEIEFKTYQNKIRSEADLPDILNERCFTTFNKGNSEICNVNKNIPDNNEKLSSSLVANEKNTDDSHLTAQNYVSKKMPFIKKSALCQKKHHAEEKDVQIIQKEVHTDVQNTDADDIEISIKIGNTITNIVIKNKKNDVQLKVNTDREVQTSLVPYSINNKADVGCSPRSSINIQNIELNVDENNKVAVCATTSTKKNTASADTAPVKSNTQFEITDSIERELSDVMEHLERKRNNKSAGASQKTLQLPKTPESANPVKLTVKETKLLDKTEHCNAPNAPSPEIAQPIVKQSDNKDIENVEVIPGDDIEDLDIFNSGSVKEANVKLLKNSKKVESVILGPTNKSKKSQKETDKREREISNDVELPSSKKRKKDLENITEKKEETTTVLAETQPKDVANDSENMNYDVIMSQVFASIDADIHNGNRNNIEKTQVLIKKTNQSQTSKTDKKLQSSQIIYGTQRKLRNEANPVNQGKTNSNINEDNQKYSENVFSMLEKDSEPHNVSRKAEDKIPATSTQQRIDKLLTPGMCRDLARTHTQSTHTDTQPDTRVETADIVHATPAADNEDSESVVEETPQKNVSFSKPKQINETVKHISDDRIPSKSAEKQKDVNHKTTDAQIIQSVINISDTSIDFSKRKDATVVDMVKKSVPLSIKDQTLETPLTINKFVNHIKHNSTPVARKSLNFDSENLDDPEQTLCPTTTQEKAFLSEAFKQTQISPIKRALTLKNIFINTKKYVAGSCLSVAESKQLKMLCQEHGWTYLDKYTKDLTHLVVAVDEDNRSQRSVKYMCALAASKWIVSFSWVETCIQSKKVVEESPFEVLDASGEPGPKCSRTAVKKVFEGITFYCLPPFSILDIDTLKEMLVAAGGRIVDDLKDVTVTSENYTKPALLLAEPEHTQEDRFMYLAMEHNVVPVNFEWTLNCLGTYSLCSIQDLLLCPASLLPVHTAGWPPALLAHTCDDE